MKLSRCIAASAVLLVCLASVGCDSGGGTPEVVTNQTDIEKYLAENPNYDEGMDDGSTEEVDQ